MKRRAATREDESELIDRLLAGDEATFAWLVDRYHNRLIHVALAYVRDRSVAEEVVQDTWVAVVTGLGKFERRSALETWIFRIVANRARTRAVREARTMPFSGLFEAGADERAVDPSRFTDKGRWSLPPRRWEERDPERLATQGETMQVLRRAIEALPPNQRAVVVLRDIEGLDSSDVCNILEVSETNQRVLLHRGRAKLRTALEAHFGKL